MPLAPAAAMRKAYALLLTALLALLAAAPAAYAQHDIPVRVTMDEDWMTEAQAWDWARWIEANVVSQLQERGGCGSIAIRPEVITESGNDSFSIRIAGRASCAKIGSLRGTFYLSRPWFSGSATGVLDFAVTGDNGRQPVSYRITGHY